LKDDRGMRQFLLIGLVIAFASVPVSRADTIVDTFDDFDPGLWPLTVGPNTPIAGNSQSGVTGVVGGVRNAQAEWTSGPSSVSANLISPPGIFSISSNVLTDGEATLSYPGQGGLNLDLTYSGPVPPGAAFIIEVVSSDMGGVPIDVTLTDGSGNSSTVGGSAAGAQTVSLPLSNFVGVDFSDIDQIDVNFNPGSEFDITADFIGFDWPDVQPEPEPASILIWSLVGLIGLVAGKRFGRR
jgi:hypothetical protein